MMFFAAVKWEQGHSNMEVLPQPHLFIELVTDRMMDYFFLKIFQ